MRDSSDGYRRGWRGLAIVFATLALLAVVACAPGWLPRPVLGLGDERRPPVRFWADGERVGVSWYPGGKERAAWAGQVNRWGVRYNVYTFDGSDVSVPTWWFVVLGAAGFVAMRALAWRGERGWRRRMRGCCERCGYDLRGSVAGRCPECGLELGKD